MGGTGDRREGGEWGVEKIGEGGGREESREREEAGL